MGLVVARTGSFVHSRLLSYQLHDDQTMSHPSCPRRKRTVLAAGLDAPADVGVAMVAG